MHAKRRIWGSPRTRDCEQREYLDGHPESGLCPPYDLGPFENHARMLEYDDPAVRRGPRSNHSVWWGAGV